MLHRSKLLALVWLTFGTRVLQGTSIVVYVEAPTVQSSSVTGVTTENFDELAPGNYTTSYTNIGGIGTYRGTPTTPFAIIAADQIGGAGGSGNYFAVGSETGSQGSVELDLSSEANYFGFWWSAGDVNNSVTFLLDGTALATFTSLDIITLLPNSVGTTVQAVNGTNYNTIDYYGNPNNGNDANEPYAYVDIIATGLQFNQILISDPQFTGFESDNHSVANGVAIPPTGDVFVSALELTPEALPEPGSWRLTILGIGVVAFARLRIVRRA